MTGVFVAEDARQGRWGGQNESVVLLDLPRHVHAIASSWNLHQASQEILKPCISYIVDSIYWAGKIPGYWFHVCTELSIGQSPTKAAGGRVKGGKGRKPIPAVCKRAIEIFSFSTQTTTVFIEAK